MLHESRGISSSDIACSGAGNTDRLSLANDASPGARTPELFVLLPLVD